ncbi:MAG: DUF11 domain-containing protein [Burkholderiales bacterium]|nr:DUF11 domain-containing protein [Burkholderiales bacterium]
MCATVLRGFSVVLGFLLSGAAYAQTADLGVALDFSPWEGASGGQFTSTFTVTNYGPDTATNAVLTNTLPTVPLGGVATFDSFPPGCSLSGVTLTCSLGNMAHNDVRTVSIVYTLGDAPGVWSSEGVVSSATPDPSLSNNTITRSVTTVSSSDLELTATGPVTPVVAGGAFQYSLQARNNGPQAVPADAAIRIQYTIPEGVQVTGASGGGFSCSPATGNAGALITCTRNGPMAVNATSTLTVNAVAMNSLSSDIDVSFALGATGSNGIAWPDPNILNNEATVTISVAVGTDVSITKTAEISDADELFFTLTPRYVRGDPLDGVLITVTDQYPALEFTFAEWISADGWACSTPASFGINMMEFTCTRTGYNGNSGTDMPPIKFRATPGASAVDATNQAKIELTGRMDPVEANNSSDVTINVNGLADMTTIKSVSFSPVVVGQDFYYTVASRNLGPWRIPAGQPIIVTDLLPDQIILTGIPTGSGWTCSVSVHGVPVQATDYPVTSTAADPVLIECEYTSGLFIGAKTPDITIPVQIATDTSIDNIACTKLGDRGINMSWRIDTNPGNDCSASGGAGVVATKESADLKITKTANPAAVDAGQPLTYTLTVANLGPDESTDIHLTDALSSLFSSGGLQSITITTIPVGGGSCSVDGNASPAFPLNGTAHTVTCEFSSLIFGESAVVEIVVLPATDATRLRSNTATVYSSEVGDPDHDNNSSTAESTVKAVYDLTVETWGSSAGLIATSAPANSVIVFTTRVRNIGISTVPTAKAVIDLPDNAAFIRLLGTPPCTSVPNPPDGTFGGTLTCEWATGIPAGAFRDVSYEVMAPSAVNSTVISDVEVGLIDPTAYDPETNLSNNNDSAEVAITPAKADIRVNINNSPSLSLGDTTTYIITVHNGGPSLATSVTMTSTFSSGTAVFSYQGGLTVDQGGTCTEPSIGVFNGQLVCTWPSLNIGESAIVTYIMRADAITTPNGLSGSNSTYVEAEATEEDPYLGNESVTEPRTTTRNPPGGSGADLGIEKTASRTQVNYGHLLEYTITVRNYGPEDVTPAHGAQVVDVLPAEIALTAVPAGCSYISVTRTLTCLVGALQVGDDYVVTVPVRVETTANRTIDNTATVDMPGDLDPDNNTATATIFARSTEGIPALSRGGMMALVMLLALTAVAYRRRENPLSPRRNG